MNIRVGFLSLICSLILSAGDVPVPAWLPPVTPRKAPDTGARGNWLTPEQGQQALDHVLTHVHNRNEWEQEATHLRQRIREGATSQLMHRRMRVHVRRGQRIQHGRRCGNRGGAVNVACGRGQGA